MMTAPSSARVHHGLRLGLLVMLSLGLACGTPSEDGDGDGDGDETADEGGGLRARGIDITAITLNQGAELTIGEGDQWIPLADRNGRLVSGRPALLGVRYELTTNWPSRALEARLTLGHADGTSTPMSQQVLVTDSTDPAYQDGVIQFSIPADLADSATTYQVEILELDEQTAAGFDVGAWANPIAGPEPLGFEGQPMELELQLVPIRATFDMAERTPAPTADELDQLTTHLYEISPVSTVKLEVHEPVDFGGQPGTFGEVNMLLQDLRVTDGAAENVYYIGLLDTGGPLFDNMVMTSGSSSATVAGPDKADAVDRVATVIYHPADLSETIGKFSLVLMKMQGRAAVPCPISSPAGADPNYPIADGKLDAWGYGVSTGAFHGPGANYDLCTICEPRWISRYGWNLIYERVEAVTAWTYE